MANNQTQAAKDSLQEELRLEEALNHLDEVHLQLRQLRSALPRMLGPLTSKQSSRMALAPRKRPSIASGGGYLTKSAAQVMYAAFAKSVEDTHKELNAFKETLSADTTKKAIQKAAESRRANPKGIKPWRFRDNQDWTTARPAKRRKMTDSKTTGTTS